MPHARTYDYLTRARARVFDAARPLSDEQYRQAVSIGPGSLAAVLTHTFISEWYYIERLLGREVAPYAQWEIRDENPPPFAQLERLWVDQSARTAAALSGVHDWDAPVIYTVTTDDGKTWRVRASASDLAVQLALHEAHHRAQALNILRRFGITIETDLDFNSMMYDRALV